MDCVYLLCDRKDYHIRRMEENKKIEINLKEKSFWDVVKIDNITIGEINYFCPLTKIKNLNNYEKAWYNENESKW